MLGYFLRCKKNGQHETCLVKRLTYRMIFDEKLKIFDGLETIRLEDGRLGCRVRHQILCGGKANLGVGMGDEANELLTLPC